MCILASRYVMKIVYLFLISGSVLFPLIAGLLRFHRLGRTWQPLFWAIVCCAVTHAIRCLSLKTGRVHPIPNNIQALVEWVLIAIQFHAWGLLRARRKLFFVFVILVALIWVTEDLIFHGITIYPPYFAVLYSFFIVLFSVRKINFIITHDDQNLFRHPVFLSCVGFIMLFTCGMIYEWAYQTTSQEPATSQEAGGLANDITMLCRYITALANVIFAIALLRVPLPQRFSLRQEPAYRP